jgi:hypothetical protein
MKTLILGLALLAVVLSVPIAKADNSSFELQKVWNAERAQQERINAEFSRIDRVAARAFNGASGAGRQKAATCLHTSEAQILTCMNCQK